jgi:hypothetical protein
VRTAEAYLRSRQSSDGLWYPGPPPTKADGLAPAVKTKRDPKDTEAAIWLTLRVLVVLRRIN